MKKLLVMFLILTSSVCFAATRQKTWGTGDPLDANPLNADWDNFYSEKVTSSNIADGAVGNSQLGTITTAGKINISSFTASGQAQGDILYYNGTAWAKLAAGTANYALVTNGAGANPAFEAELGWTKMARVTFNTTTDAVKDCYPAGVTITNIGVGNNTVNWPTAFADTNYCVQVSSGTGAQYASYNVGTKAVGSVAVYNHDDTGTVADTAEESVFAFGD